MYDGHMTFLKVRGPFWKRGGDKCKKSVNLCKESFANVEDWKVPKFESVVSWWGKKRVMRRFIVILSPDLGPTLFKELRGGLDYRVAIQRVEDWAGVQMCDAGFLDMGGLNQLAGDPMQIIDCPCLVDFIDKHESMCYDVETTKLKLISEIKLKFRPKRGRGKRRKKKKLTGKKREIKDPNTPEKRRRKFKK